MGRKMNIIEERPLTKEEENIILERDGGYCQLCGCTRSGNSGNKQLSVHHVDLGYSNHQANNLITLCNMCHITVHGVHVRDAFQEKFWENINRRAK